MANILGSKLWGVYKVGHVGLALVQYSFCFRMHKFFYCWIFFHFRDNRKFSHIKILLINVIFCFKAALKSAIFYTTFLSANLALSGDYKTEPLPSH